MRLSELLDRRVVDDTGHEFGRVLDVRLVQDGPVQPSFGAAYRLQGLIVGPPRAGTRLGYGRTGMTGPAMLAAPLRVRHRAVRFVPWDRVARLDTEVIRISGSSDDLSEPGPIPA